MPAGSHHFQVGEISCTVLTDGYAAYPTGWFFPDADPARLGDGLRSHGLPVEHVLSPYSCLLIETGRRVILADAGAGPSVATSGAIAARLEMAGIRPKDVDTVVLSHAHPDHIGGAVDTHGRPAFPNACHVIAEREREFWMRSRGDLSGMRLPEDVKCSMQAAARRCLAALHFKLETIERETEIAPGVTAIPAPGHTPGHLALLIASGGQKLLNLADAAVHPLHLQEPDWQNGFDLAADCAIATRRSLLERAAAENMHVMAFHFPFPSLGRIAARQQGGWEWSPGW
ncbi:MAG TPA: MBL fold metallo-hydrolase [Candidatus Sulfopaludibacter sp.]|nr:MBL fold metallo-hydrolase [Candidatus Sulfopaludibacter sp.]